MKTLIIAEAGVNHNGDLELAYRLCDAAMAVGADVVKFQTWKTENLLTRSVAQADYQSKNTGVQESQYDMLKKLELSYDDFRRIKEHCDKIGIQFATTADDFESLDFISTLDLPFLKIGSGEMGNLAFLRAYGSKGLPIIMSTGMSTLADVDISLQAVREGGASDITLLHCTTNYPCPYNRVNLRAMKTLSDAFHLPVGYSDHTIGMEVALAAVTMGATVIEKHFTLDSTMEGPDHAASTEPAEFAQMVRSIRNLEEAMGDGVKVPTLEERDISKVVTKRIVAAKEIVAGSVIREEDITIKRHDVGVRARYWDMIVGRTANRNYVVDEGIEL